MGGYLTKVRWASMSYFIEASLYFRAYDFNCRCGLRVYFFSSFTGARSTAPSRKRQSPLKPRMPGYQGSFLNILAQPSSSFSSSFHVLRLLSSCLCLRATEVFGEHHVNLSDDSLAVGITSLKDVFLTSTPRRKLTKGTYMTTKTCVFFVYFKK